MDVQAGITGIQELCSWGDWRAAGRRVEQYLKEHPGQAEGLFLRGYVLYQSNKHFEAQQQFKEALVIDPFHPYAQAWIEYLSKPEWDHEKQEPPAIPGQLRPKKWFNPLQLYLQPRRFFVEYGVYPNPWVILILVCFIGLSWSISNSQERFTNVLFSPGHDISILFESWQIYWILMVFGGISGGVFYYAFFGILFRLGLKICGAKATHIAASRRIMVYTSFAFLLPHIIFMIGMPFLFESPLALFTVNDFYLILLTTFYMVLYFYTAYIGYCGIRVCTGAGKWRVRILYLLPQVSICAFLMTFMIVILCAGSFEEPDLINTKTYEDEYVSFQYPGNWEVEEYYDIAWEEEWEEQAEWSEAVEAIQPDDPSPTPRIAPWAEEEQEFNWDDWDNDYQEDYVKYISVFMPDTYTSVDIYIFDASVTFQAKFDEYEEYYSDTEENYYKILDRYYHWGDYPGIEYFLKYEHPDHGVDEYYIYRDFFGYVQKRMFNVEWSCEYDEYFLTQPGYELIRDTFELKDYTLPDVKESEEQ